MSDAEGGSFDLSILSKEETWQAVTMWTLVAYGFLSLAQFYLSALDVTQRKEDKYYAKEFNIPQDSFVLDSIRRIGGVPEPKSGDKTLVNKALKPVVEMAYWFVKFVGDYNKLYKTAKATSKASDLEKEDDSITKYFFTKSTARLVKFARYLLKYQDNFEKLYKAAEKFSKTM